MSETAGAFGQILGVILAGGQSRRMGSEKGLINLGGRPLIAHAIERLGPQVHTLVVNANGDASRFTSFGLTVIADPIDGFPGPLAGVLAGMRHARRYFPDVTHVATVAVDTPFFPSDCVQRLTAALKTTPGARLAFAKTEAGAQPVFALVHVSLADALENDIASGAANRVVEWLLSQPYVVVHFTETAAFFNVNTAEDLAAAEVIARG